ncbi:MAG: HIT family protein [Candidatus Paceibacterota bacterium]|jgi:histidine triad (HIT) family protein
MNDCLFCRIANKEIPAHIICEDKDCVAFLDINPHSMGHSVVISKSHSENILDIEDKELQNLFLTVKKTTALLQKSLNPDGFTIGINHGEIAGQAVKHLHVHILPRYKNDKGGSIHSVVLSSSEKTVEEVKEIIKKNS